MYVEFFLDKESALFALSGKRTRTDVTKMNNNWPFERLLCTFELLLKNINLLF